MICHPWMRSSTCSIEGGSPPSLPWVIIASGPSLTQEQVDYCQGKARVIAINDNYRLAPWADILYACDEKWWKWNPEALDFKGEKWTQDKSWNENERKRHEERGVNFIQSEARPGLSTKKDVIYQGSNSGIQAINLAYLMGARKIILIGYDMKLGEKDKAHWFGDHPDKIKSNYNAWFFFYKVIADQLSELGLEIINSTIDSALTCFPKKELKEALNGL